LIFATPQICISFIFRSLRMLARWQKFGLLQEAKTDSLWPVAEILTLDDFPLQGKVLALSLPLW
jgi:hypothetical protein